MARPAKKWILGIDADAGASLAARESLRQRLLAVWQSLGPAALRPEEDIEHVHQLRVATRRAMAVLSMYRDMLPKRRRRRIKQQLKQVRRVAGPARDDDVLIQRLTLLSESNPAYCNVVAELQTHRAAVQPKIVRLQTRLKKARFPTRLRELASRARWRESKQRSEPTLKIFATSALRCETQRFFAAAAEDLSELAALHQFRIAGKRLRYSIELFAVVDPRLREDAYPIIEKLQSCLGELNDHAAAEARFRAWRRHAAPRDHPILDQLADSELAEIEKSRRRFQRFWTSRRVRTLQQILAEILQPS